MVVGAVALILVLLLMLIGSRRSGPRDLLAPPTTIEVSPDVEREAHDLILRGRKIAAIKLVRKRSGIGLKEAKDFVERIETRS